MAQVRVRLVCGSKGLLYVFTCRFMRFGWPLWLVGVASVTALELGLSDDGSEVVGLSGSYLLGVSLCR